ncbi:MAG: glycoside hydrolase family 3 C-terminal domain-containing protein [Tissierellales bacterium]|nr:glycoside hydrolase family 3 C-terminal domain-containing protein [Tissierellales bacterium]
MEQAEKIIERLDLDEKINILSGKNFWQLHDVPKGNLKSIMLTDGPNGLRKQEDSADNLGLNNSVKATCFPTASCMASSWDEELIYEVGEHLANECLTERVSVLLGPGINLKRNPLCGRNFEYYSEDPLLSGKMAKSWINGLQSKQIGASLKHFAANNQEYYRMVSDSIIDERTLHELYLKGFEIAVKESKPWTVMSSYNYVNGVRTGESKELLTDILRNEWGFDGAVVSDWTAVDNKVASIKAGLDLEMPGNNGLFNQEVKRALKSGELTVEELDKAVLNVLNLIIKAQNNLEKEHNSYDKEAHHKFAKKVATESVVLLKNENSILPLTTDKKVALIGEFAKKPRFQGSGSSQINPTKLSNAYDEFKKKLGDNLLFASGYDLKKDEIEESLLKEACEIASKADIAVLMVGLPDSYESEGFDRKHIDMPQSHNALITEISKIQKNIIVVLSNGAPVTMPWENDVDGIVELYLAGQASGEAITEIIFGDVNPSGKLAETFPLSLETVPSTHFFPGEPRQVQYREGLYIGYRAHDSFNTEVLFPFGHGLSYTNFEYSDIKTDKLKYTKDDLIEVYFNLKNTGDRDGKEICQLYVEKVDSKVYRPKKELKAFSKVELKSGETKQVMLSFKASDLFVFQNGKFKVESGKYTIHVGASSRDIRLSSELVIDTDDIIYDDKLDKYKNITSNYIFTEKDFENLLGRPIPKPVESKPYTRNSTLGEIKDNFIGKRILSAVEKQISTLASGDDNAMSNMIDAMIYQMPLRTLASFSGGAISINRIDGLVDLMNKKYFSGIAKLIKG